MKIKQIGITIGSDMELFFNKESKNGTWEITYDSTNNILVLCYFDDNRDMMDTISINKKEFMELKHFVKDIQLRKNYKLKNKEKSNRTPTTKSVK